MGVLISYFRREPTEESLEYARQMLEEAEKRLKKIKEETFSIKSWMPASPIWPTIQTLNTNLELLNIFKFSYGYVSSRV